MNDPEKDDRPPRLIAMPWWVHVLDALTVIALVAALIIEIVGGFVLSLRLFQLSSHAVWRPVIVGLVLGTVRHALVPAPPLHRRLIGWMETTFVDGSRASIIVAAAASRIAVLIAGYVAVLIIGLPERYGFRLSSDPLFNLPARFDAGWYAGIAQAGYEFPGTFERQQSIAFFPAFPMILRMLGHVAGGFDPGVSREQRTARLLWAGVLFSIIAFTWAALYLRRLAGDTIGPERATAAVVLIAAYPFAVFFSVPYTESLFLLASVAAFHHYRRREWIRAALWGALVGLTRPNGCLMSIVLASVAAEQLWRTSSSRWREYPFALAVLAAAAPVAGMLAYSAFVDRLTGSWFGWARVQSAWGRHFVGLPLARIWEWIDRGSLMRLFAETPVEATNTVGLIFALALLWPTFRRVGLAGGVFVLVNIVPPMLTGSVLSMGRFTSTLFPIFLGLAAVLPRPLLTPLLIAFAVGQGLVAVLFFTWRPLF